MYRIDNENKDTYATRNPRAVIIDGKVYYRDRAVPAPSRKHAKTADDFARIAHNKKVAREGINTKYDPFNFNGGIGFKPFAPRYYFK